MYLIANFQASYTIDTVREVQESNVLFLIVDTSRILSLRIKFDKVYYISKFLHIKIAKTLIAIGKNNDNNIRKYDI